MLALMGADHPGAMVVTDAPPPGVAPTILYCNLAFTRLCGYPPGEVLGRSPSMLQGPKTDPRAVRALARAVARREATTVVLLNHRRDGTPYLAEVALRPLRGPGGEHTHFVGLSREVARRRGRPGAAGRYLPVASGPDAPLAFAAMH